MHPISPVRASEDEAPRFGCSRPWGFAMVQQSSPRRDLLYFGVPVLLTLAAALAYHLRPWPIAVPAQAAVFAWPVVIAILAVGAIGVGLSSRVGCASAP